MTDTPSVEAAPPLVRVLWGKTDDLVRHRPPEGRWHPLLFHLIDTANVAGVLWDTYLSPAVKSALGGEELGRPLFRWLCSLHDIGKATLVFQQQSARHFTRVQQCSHHAGRPEPCRHELLSSQLVRDLLEELGWRKGETLWIGILLAAHHGRFPGHGRTHRIEKEKLGGPEYRAAQRYLFDSLTDYCEIDLDRAREVVLDPGAQMAAAGALVMSDWLASNEAYFRYGTEERKTPPHRYAPTSVTRASRAFHRITQLQDVWQPAPGTDAHSLYRNRFEIHEPRDTQVQADTLARATERPGLMVIEAPTGEGKTEAALAAAEVLADKFGRNGLFFALPTQATTNGIFDRLLKQWSKTLAGNMTANLAHGKARLKKEFENLPLGGIGEDPQDSLTASTWMRGSKKALLSPLTIGTIDQLLFAGVAARYVQLRHIGLVNKVVVIDEVHAYDTYMSTILQRVLHWLGWHQVPVILLSATLPPEQRENLLSAYTGASKVLVERSGYPRLTWADAPTRDQRVERGKSKDPMVLRSQPATTTRDNPIRLGFFPEQPKGDLHGLIERELGGTRQGNILVLRNTVRRAQSTYESLKAKFGDFKVTLAHAKFTSGDRASKDAELLRLYGPPDRETKEHPDRPKRSIVVATQVVEQSLDIDFDLIISDLAPIDLLLQRAGRCHRHDRRDHVRGSLTEAKLIITGYRQDGGGIPSLTTGTRMPYDHHLLQRTFAILNHPEQQTEIKVPAEVPDLITRVYGDEPLGPDSWQEELGKIAEDANRNIKKLNRLAQNVLVGELNPDAHSLKGIFRTGTDQQVDDDEEEAVARHHLPVRHGPPSVEVVLLYRIAGRKAAPVSELGKHSPVTIPLSRAPEGEELELIGEQTIRIPERDLDLSTLSTPKGWTDAHWARNLRVLFLDQEGKSKQGKRNFQYSSETGWKEQ